ncbi:MAG: hypothetical protein H6839_16690 [Planctomycetes bacterium]|nr:hypothetical protein [Planctomycetota bacterium]
MNRSTRWLWLVSMLLLLAQAPAAADDAPAPHKVADTAPETPETKTLAAEDPTLQAWARLQTARAEAKTLKDAFSGLFQKMETEEGKAAARAVFSEVYKQAGTMEWKAEQTFLKAFDASDWKKWEGEEHAEMLRDGLNMSAQEAIETDPKHSVKAWELLVEKFPDSNEAAYARSTWLPIALPATGELDLALEHLLELHKQVPEMDKPGIRMAIGDVYCMLADFEKARTEFQGALDDIMAAGELEKYDRRKSVHRYAQMRLDLVGKPAPEVDSKTWIGGEAKKLSDLKGTVVVLDYWATW